MTDGRKPCLALMGEFSAGKSTLANLLIGANPLPVQVVATQLPPVRISHGTGAAFAVDLDGTRCAIDLAALDRMALDDVLFIQIFCEEDILLHCDLLDMPGISDPNMDAQVWERMIDQADGVLWCSHATQAWRQSEAAVWADMPPDLHARSLLLLTRIDKLTSPADRARVLARVRRETEGLFADVLPISLLLATREQSDYAAWAESGAEAFSARLIRLLADLNADLATGAAPGPRLALPGLEGPARPPGTPTPAPAAGRVLPRRVHGPGTPSARPPA